MTLPAWFRRLHPIAALLLLATPLVAQQSKAPPAPALLVAPLAGLSVPVLPVSYLIADSGTSPALPVGLRARLRWADSLIGEVLQARGPEVVWLLPDELRRVARRAPGTVSDPDRMGQAMLRADGFKRIPDPLFSQLRAIAAMTNARQVMIPAAVRFATVAEGVRAEVVLVLGDARNGVLLWRSTPRAVAATPAEALVAAVAKVLPDFD